MSALLNAGASALRKAAPASRLGLIIIATLGLASALPSAFAQSAVASFESPGQFTNSFAVWNDAGGQNGGNAAFVQSPTAGVGGSGGVSVFQNTDTTATYTNKSWNFSQPGTTLNLSVLVHANGQVSGDKVQFGITTAPANGLNNNPGVAFETFRVIPDSATSWSLREQYRSANTLKELTLGSVPIVTGHWYQFTMVLTNAAPGSYTASCALTDFGPDGLAPGANIVGFPTAQSHTGQTDVTAAAVWPALRAFQDAGIDAWDAFAVFTPDSGPLLAQPLTDVTARRGTAAQFRVLAEGPGPLQYRWLTNGIPDESVTGPSFASPPLEVSWTNVTVTVSNANGSVTNSSVVSVFQPILPTLENLPATGVLNTSAILHGRVDATGGDTPALTLYYGTTDGGTNPAAWSAQAALGLQSGDFARAVGGLAPARTYYYTVAGTNAAGGPAWAAPSATFTTLLTNPPTSGAAVLTQHNDNGRTGTDLAETILNVTNVNSQSFGLLYTRPVDDQIYAQPLFVPGLDIPGQGVHDVVIVATVNDSIYAFDANDPTVSTPYWSTNFTSAPDVVAPRNTDLSGACGGNYQDFSGAFGIVGTPVIDPATQTLYVVVRTKEHGTTFVQRLHALDIRNGTERPNSPVVIAAQVPGNGDGSVNGVVHFDPEKNNQRAGLLLVNGLVYITWSSHCDWGPYHGWLIGYDAATLEQRVVYNDTPEGYNGGIWMSGQGPAADPDGNVYLTTGNGSVGLPSDPRAVVNRGESFLKLTPNGSGMDVTSWFTPSNWQQLENGDIDLGSGGLLLIPGTNLVFGGGKQGIVYLVNRDAMGGLSSTSANTNVIQSFQVSANQVHGGAVWWDGPSGPCAYLWPSAAQLQQYQFDRAAGRFVLPAVARGSVTAPSGQPGGILALSANGTQPGTGVLWASHQLQGDANQSTRPGILRAYDAADVSRELYNSQQVSTRDAVGNFAKFCAPTVANGRVYLATFSNRLDVFGLFPAPALTIEAAAGEATLSWKAVSGVNYTLQSSPNLQPGSWTPVTNTVQIVSGVAQVKVSAQDKAAFYRVQN